MAQTSFDIDERTSEALDHLKRVYGVQTNAGVIKRALAIALAASKFADPEYNIHIKSEAPNGSDREVILPKTLSKGPSPKEAAPQLLEVVMADEGRRVLEEIDAFLSVKDHIDLEELKLRSEIARRIIGALTRVNVGVLITVSIIFLLEMLFLYWKIFPAEARVVNTHVLMSIVGATTVQFGAIAFAVSQWLFPKRKS